MIPKEMGEASWRSFVEEIRRGKKLPFEEHWSRFREAYADRSPEDPPPFAWWPDDAVEPRSNLFSLKRDLGLESYAELHRFTVENRAQFWERAIDRLGIVFATPPDEILDLSRGPRDPRWLPGASLDITESCFGADPERTAIVYGRGREAGGALERTSYGELRRSVNRFASGLRAQGFRPGEAVALYMPMTPSCVVAYLGTIRAGLRVLSIPDSFSAEELRKRLSIGEARAVVTVSSYRRAGREIALYPKVREASAELDSSPRAIVLEAKALEEGDLSFQDLLSEEDEFSPHVAAPEHVTNVLFSSGTTGSPKAIPWTELTPIKCGTDAHFHQDVHPEDVVCWPTNVGWMMGPWLIYASLLNRAAMALYEGAPAGGGFSRFVRDAGITVLGVVPSMVRNWRANDTVEEGDWTSVRLFSSTGEASSAEDYLWLMSRTQYRAPVIEYLGGTEIGGGHLTGTLLQPASPATFTTPALGIDFLILDEDGRPVRALEHGGAGELFLIPPSIGLSQTLLNASHDEVYYEGCPSGPNGELLRRHGDRIQVLPGGYYKAEGRSDDAMNLGGIKVGSLELERIANEHPAVFESAAVGVVEGGEGAEKLVLYVVPREKLERDVLRKELSAAIARKMNPLFKVHDVVVLDALPRTASNKIMRRSLRAAYGK